MKKVFLMFCLCAVTVSGQDGSITCTIPHVQMFQDTVLTCNFPENLNVTRRDFGVYHNPTGDRDAVVDCWWIKGNMSCYVKPDVTFDVSVNRMLQITFIM